MTSWVLSLLLAAQLEDWENLIYIEPKLINHAVAFILEHQRDDGSFWEPASNVTHDFKMSYKGMSLESEESRMDTSLTALTALVTTVLNTAGPTLDGSLQVKATSARLKSTRFLEKQLDNLWDSYDVAITTYALVVVGSPAKEVAIKMLESHAKVSGKLMHWSRSPINSNVRLRENNQRTFLLPKEPQEWDSYAVEATSYALLVFLTQEGVTQRAESITEWLVSVRNWDFAYSSTLDTVLAYRAMAEYSFRARLRDITNVQVQVEVTSRPGTQNTIQISNQSLVSMNYIKVTRPWGHVNLVAHGSGQAIAQLETRWGVELDRFLKKPPREYFSLKVEESYLSFRNKTVISIKVCTRWLATDISPTSHAAILEVFQATGYTKNQGSANKAVKKIQESSVPHLMNVKTSAKTMFFQFHHVSHSHIPIFNHSLKECAVSGLIKTTLHW
ncbi:hypothetical protein SK128_009994 [Halocaridina rubra]|uniref:Alpha-macroglobulin-like TED domain-containing protein n=1 Tax=Halocaridina rubra TaxID=373956 RepID=A0AAN8XKC5_HALRR